MIVNLVSEIPFCGSHFTSDSQRNSAFCPGTGEGVGGGGGEEIPYRNDERACWKFSKYQNLV